MMLYAGRYLQGVLAGEINDGLRECLCSGETNRALHGRILLCVAKSGNDHWVLDDNESRLARKFRHWDPVPYKVTDEYDMSLEWALWDGYMHLGPH